eukprot:5974225-Prymnesium_polylepis.1
METEMETALCGVGAASAVSHAPVGAQRRRTERWWQRRRSRRRRGRRRAAALQPAPCARSSR